MQNEPMLPPIPVAPPRIETARLLLRPLGAADAGAVRRLAGERAVAETTLLIPHPYPEGAAEAWIATHAPKFDAGELVNCAITRREDGVV